MKLQFKEQDFQVQAVKAVVDCFEGQPLKTNRFTLERSKELMRKAKQAALGLGVLDFEVEEEIGYRNALHLRLGHVWQIYTYPRLSEFRKRRSSN